MYYVRDTVFLFKISTVSETIALTDISYSIGTNFFILEEIVLRTVLFLIFILKVPNNDKIKSEEQ